MGFSRSSETVSVVAQGNEGGGAALDQVIGMSVVALVVTAGLLWIGYLHRQRRITWLNELGRSAGRKFKRPPWVALPMALFIATLICALFGFIWDVSLHIGNGRDPGPLANPAHYFILFGFPCSWRAVWPGSSHVEPAAGGDRAADEQLAGADGLAW